LIEGDGDREQRRARHRNGSTQAEPGEACRVVEHRNLHGLAVSDRKAANAFVEKNPDVTVDVKSIDTGRTGMDKAVDDRLATALPMPATFQKTSPDSTQKWDSAGEVADLNDM
jgi:hypothetical protein